MVSRRSKLLRFGLPALGGVLLLVIIALKINQWDQLAPLSLIPIWCWTLVGLACSLIGFLLGSKRWSLFVCIAWVAVGVGLASETTGILRSLFRSTPEITVSEDTLRLLNVNCAGKIDVVATALERDPDVLFLQQSPQKEELEAWFRKSPYAEDYRMTISRRVGMLSKGKVIASIPDPKHPVIHTRVEVKETVLDVTVLDLDWLTPQAALWNPEIWTYARETRISNRRIIRQSIGSNPMGKDQVYRFLVGGFYCPAGDDSLRPLQVAGLKDAYNRMGDGTGNTYPAENPLLRLDQIWMSESVRNGKLDEVEIEGSNHLGLELVWERD